MRLLKQIIEKKIDLYNEFSLNRQYLRSIWQFYVCYNLCLSVLGIRLKDNEIRERNKIWKKWLCSGTLFNEKKFKKIQEYIQKDMKIIIQALNRIEEINAENPYEMGDIDKPSMIGILSYEFPE